MTKSDAQTGAVPPSDGGRGARTRERILDAASLLVAERGWTAVTTRAIADRAGVNQALVHYHFGSKGEVLRCAVGRALHRDLEAALGPLLRARSVLAGIDEALAVVGAIDTSSQSGMLLAEAMLRATRDEGLRGTLAAELERARLTLAERVADGIADGEIRRGVAPGAVAALVVALLDGLFLHRLVSPGIDVGAVRAALGEMLVPPDRGGSRAAGRGAREGGS